MLIILICLICLNVRVNTMGLALKQGPQIAVKSGDYCSGQSGVPLENLGCSEYRNTVNEVGATHRPTLIETQMLCATQYQHFKSEVMEEYK